jgi:Hydroxymethylglutaryl-coenzyme A synthase N terminal
MSSTVSKVRQMTASWARAAKSASGVSAAPLSTSAVAASNTGAKPAFHQSRPHNVGVVAIETYVAGRCVSQEDLEKADGVSAGKYTVGEFRVS